MHRTMLAALFAPLIVIASPALGEERRYTVTDFERIQIEGPFTVSLTTGKSPAAVAAGSAQAIDRVSIEVEGRTMRIRPNRSAWGGYPGDSAGPLAIAVSTHGLRGVSVTGSGSVDIDTVEAMRFDIGLSGSGRVGVGSIEADHLILGLLGSGEIEIGGGAVEELRATIEGTGELDAAGLTAEEAEINAGTSGTVKVAVRRAAEVNATGAGDITILGSPSCTVNARGSGLVVCSD